jgi:hypothetical protein
MRRVSAFLRQRLPIIRTVLVFLAVVVVVWIFSAPFAQWSRSAQSFVVAVLWEHYLAAVTRVVFLLVLVLIEVPKWQAARLGLTPQTRFKAENDTRKTLAEIIGSAAVLAGLLFTWGNLRATQEGLRITQETATRSQDLTREGQITERFIKAIDQLGAVTCCGSH